METNDLVFKFKREHIDRVIIEKIKLISQRDTLKYFIDCFGRCKKQMEEVLNVKKIDRIEFLSHLKSMVARYAGLTTMYPESFKYKP